MHWLMFTKQLYIYVELCSKYLEQIELEEDCTHHRCTFLFHFYPRDAMLARVFATATCPSVCPSVVRHTPVLCLAEQKQDREMYTVW